MTSPMHFDAGARALDALPAAESTAFDEHVQQCDVCSTEYAEFLATAAMLAAAVAETPPAGLRERVLRAAEVTPQLAPIAAPDATDMPAPVVGGDEAAAPAALGRHRRGRRWFGRPLTLVAAAVVALLIAGGAIAVWPRTSPTQAAARCVAHASDATVRHPTVGAGGSVTVARSCDAAVVDPATLPAPHAGRAYQLWLIAGSNARSPGMVAQLASKAGQIVVTGIHPADTAIGISVEPVGGSKTPTTQPVWIVPLKS